MLNEQLKTERVSEVPLTERENQVLEIAKRALINGSHVEGKKELIEFMRSTGVQVDLVESGSNPNVGSFFRNWFATEGQLTLMDTSSVPEELKIYELAHEYMYLQMHVLAVPDVRGVRDVENGAAIFTAGLPARIAADIKLAQLLTNESMRNSIIKEKTELLEKLHDPEYAFQKSRDFITYH